MKKIFLLLVFLPLILMASSYAPSQQRLDQTMAPIALYPDSLLSQILMASTYPQEVQEAVEWSRHNSDLQGEDAVQAAASNDWDPSVISLVAFPQVLDMMDQYPAWVQELGDAFLDEPDMVMDSVQRLRLQAQRNGYLTSSQKQKIIMQEDDQGTRTIIIQPTFADTVYVPVYDPMRVYGSWFYPGYAPFYYYPSSFYMAPGMFFGFSLGIAVRDVMWSSFDWYHHDVYINVPRYNTFYTHRKINTNQKNISWKNDWRPNNSHPINYNKPQTQRIIIQNNDRKPNDRVFKTNDRKPDEKILRINDRKPEDKIIRNVDRKPDEKTIRDQKPDDRTLKNNDRKPDEKILRTNDRKPDDKIIRNVDRKPDDKNVRNNDRKSDDGNSNSDDKNNFQHGQRN